jgi:phage/plasmid-like protein (TIGR03299 family)
MKFAEANKLDWSVREEQVQTASGIIIEGQKCIIRNDTDKPLSIMADSYQPFQNQELFELLERVSNQTGMEIKKSGLFGNGEKVFIQLKSDDLRLGNDKVEGYLTGINSFDGSTSLAFGPSNITISCTNSFFGAFRGLNTKIRHTKNMGVRIEDVLKSLDLTLVKEKEMFRHIVQLSETRIGEEDIDNVIRKLFDVNKEIDLEDDEAMSTVTKNKIERFYVDLNGELKGKGDNLWGLFSGVTKYTTHSMNKGNTDRNQENKMFGVYGNRERIIFNELVEMV